MVDWWRKISHHPQGRKGIFWTYFKINLWQTLKKCIEVLITQSHKVIWHPLTYSPSCLYTMFSQLFLITPNSSTFPKPRPCFLNPLTYYSSCWHPFIYQAHPTHQALSKVLKIQGEQNTREYPVVRETDL